MGIQLASSKELGRWLERVSVMSSYTSLRPITSLKG